MSANEVILIKVSVDVPHGASDGDVTSVKLEPRVHNANERRRERELAGKDHVEENPRLPFVETRRRERTK